MAAAVHPLKPKITVVADNSSTSSNNNSQVQVRLQLQPLRVVASSPSKERVSRLVVLELLRSEEAPLKS